MSYVNEFKCKERNFKTKDKGFLYSVFNACMCRRLIVSELLRPYVRINRLPNNALIQILLYGGKDFSIDVNKNILKLTLNFIHKTGQFN